jgi:hypothetical protein
MSQHVNSTESAAGLTKKGALLIGHVLCIIGWTLFALCVVSTLDASQLRKGESSFAGPSILRKIGDAFQITGYWLVPGWFLLRFADGLFPFSRKFSKQPAG